MNNLLHEIHEIHFGDSDVFSVNPELENLSLHEQIAEIGQAAVFLKNNLYECIDLFGVKITSELIEDSQNGFNSLIQMTESFNSVPSSAKYQPAAKSTPNTSHNFNTPPTKPATPKNPPNDFNSPPQSTHTSDIWETIKGHSKEIGWTVLAAIALTAGYKIYKNYFSKAARACKGKTGTEKDACMINYQIQAYKLKKQALQKSLSMANRTKDSIKFKNKINSEIKKIDKKIK
jgi:hypothetical protein